ncbi:uncharacterized protein METZ01_LOCUS76590 [marine metagenome]|jgi:hypothetical protein|uniref:Uncharacterized protein n=1 Tax=marine metagenome TaxID=408172 RepID=A0A381U694_9ZZZZ
MTNNYFSAELFKTEFYKLNLVYIKELWEK